MLSSLRRFARRLRRAEGGAAAVELGFALPVMVGLIIGVEEIGRALWYHQTVSKGVRDAVRYLTRVPADPDTCAFDAIYETRAKNLVLYGGFIDTGSPLVKGWTDASEVVIQSEARANPGLRGPDPLCLVAVQATPDFRIMGRTLTFWVRDQQRHIGE